MGLLYPVNLNTLLLPLITLNLFEGHYRREGALQGAAGACRYA